jgi:hypothetical protein
MNEDKLEAGKTIWQWLPTHDEPVPAEMIFVLGNKSDALPGEAAKLFNQKLAPLIVVSGGYGRLTKNDVIGEADRYLKVLRELGIPDSAIKAERASTNTGENILFTQRMLTAQGYAFEAAIAVTTAMLSRRHRATLQKLWPSITWIAHTPTPIPFEERIEQDNVDEFFDLMVGEVDRLQKYPDRGFMDEINIPADVLTAQRLLVDAGHTKYLVPES